MIRIEVNTDDKEIHCKGEVHIEGTKSQAVDEFLAVLDLLDRSDKLILMLAMNDYLRDYLNE